MRAESCGDECNVGGLACCRLTLGKCAASTSGEPCEVATIEFDNADGTVRGESQRTCQSNVGSFSSLECVFGTFSNGAKTAWSRASVINAVEQGEKRPKSVKTGKCECSPVQRRS